MNYGQSAYTKVLEVEKRIGANQTIIYDSGVKTDFDFIGNYKISGDKLIFSKLVTVFFTASFSVTSSVDQRIKFEYMLGDTVIEEKSVMVQANLPCEVNWSFSHTKQQSDCELICLNIIPDNAAANNVVSSYRLIAINAKIQEENTKNRGVELKGVKTPEGSYIVSYTGDNSVVYACEIFDKNSVLEFYPIINAISHCFVFDEYDDLHLYYVDQDNNLYDKTIGSIYNDKFICDNVSVVHAIKCGDGMTSSIVVCFITKDKSKVKYCFVENGVQSEILDITLPDNKYEDLCMVSSRNFVYLVVETMSSVSFILKSAFEPLSACMFENISSSYAVVVSKYYTLSDYADNLFDTISASFSVNAGVALNYEKILENILKSNIKASFSLTADIYDMPKEEPVLYTVVIDKSNTNYLKRCTYADDAEGLEGATNRSNAAAWNGWPDRFPYNKIKPCVLRAGEFVGYLNPNDYTLFEDGTPVNSERADNFVDVMVEIPKVYYLIENIDPYVYVHISNVQIDERYKCYAHVYDGVEVDKIYVAAYHSGYKMYNGKNTMFSFTGAMPDLSNVVSNLNFETLLENKEVGYRMLNFDQTVLFQCLFIIMFKSTGSAQMLGGGNYDMYGSVMNNGYCDKLGMYSGDTTTDTVPCKMFGIENIYGNAYTWVDGVSIFTAYDYPNYTLKRRNPYSSVPINRQGEGYDEYKNPALDGLYDVGFYMSDPYATTELGFLPQSKKYPGSSTSANYSRFYCDAAFLHTSYGLWYGGDNEAYSYGGIFHYDYDDGEINNDNVLGYRLVYYPIGGKV